MSQEEVYSILKKNREKMTVNDICDAIIKKRGHVSKNSVQVCLKRLTNYNFIARESPNKNNEFFYWIIQNER